MTDPVTIRVSSLPRLAACPASHATALEARAIFEIPEDVGSDATRIGNAYHALNEINARGHTLTNEDIDGLAARYSVDPTELRMLWSRIDVLALESAQAWVEERLTYSAAVFGREVQISGQADLVRYWPSRDGGLVRVDDWKSGRADPVSYEAQVRAYAALWARHLRERLGLHVETAEASVWSARHGVPHVVRIAGAARLEAAFNDALKTAVDAVTQTRLPPAKRSYSVGKACTFCEGKPICPAYRSMTQSAVVLGTGLELIDPKAKPSKLTKARKAELTERIEGALAAEPRKFLSLLRFARWIADNGSKAIRDRISMFGPLELGDGYRLELVEQTRRPNVNEGHIRAAMQFEGLEEDLIQKVLAHIETRTPGAVFVTREVAEGQVDESETQGEDE